MDKLKNGDYLAPEVEVIEYLAQGIICQSPSVDPGNPFGDNVESPW